MIDSPSAARLLCRHALRALAALQVGEKVVEKMAGGARGSSSAFFTLYMRGGEGGSRVHVPAPAADAVYRGYTMRKGRERRVAAVAARRAARRARGGGCKRRAKCGKQG